MYGAGRDQRGGGKTPAKRRIAGGDRQTEENRDDGGGEERQPRRAQKEPALRQPWPHFATAPARQLGHVTLRSRHPPLAVLEEGHLLLVPVLEALGRDLELAVRVADRSPQ